MRMISPTSANVNITVAKNTTFSDAFQFDSEDDTTWDFLNKTFRMGVKGNFEQDDDVITFTSGASEIVVADPSLRVLYFNVPRATMEVVLVPGCYFYDLLMTDTSTAVVTQLMHGDFHFAEAVTGG